MNKAVITDRIDTAIRFFLYVLIFWLPYSPAVVESCVVVSLILWVVKRIIVCDFLDFKDLNARKKISTFLNTFKPKKNFLNTPILCFLFTCLLSVAGSAFWGIALRGFLTKTLEWFVIYFLVIEVFTERKHIFIALSVFLFSALATCLDSLVQFHITHKDIFRSRVISPGGRAVGPFARPSSLAGYLTFVIPLALSYVFAFNKKARPDGLATFYARVGISLKFRCYKKMWRRFSAITFFIVTLWAGVVTFSRGALIGISAGIFFVLYSIKKKFLFQWVVLSVVGGICFYIFSSSNVRNQVRVDPQELYNTLEWRRNLWVDSLKMIKDRPFFGHGLNTYMNVFQEYRRKLEDTHPYDPSYAHNCYIQIAGETGWVGLICFFWIIGRFFKRILKIIKNPCVSGERFDTRMLLVGLSAGAFAFLVHSFVDTNFYSLQLSALFWFMMGTTVSLLNLKETESVHNRSNNHMLCSTR